MAAAAMAAAAMAASTATLGVRAERLTAAALAHAPAAATALRHNARDADGAPTVGASAFLGRRPAFLGAKHAVSVATAHPARRSTVTVAAAATATAAVSPLEQLKQYERPDWATFEMGHPENAVYWQSANGGGLPNGIVRSGETVTIYYNAHGTKLDPSFTDGNIFFNGGFNGPFMCGGEPRPMAKRERGPACSDIFSIRVNVPRHARTLEFSFTDGQSWDGRYKIEFVLHPSVQGKPKEALDEGLAEEMASASACDDAIFPDLVPVLIKCPMPGGVGLAGGDRCDLDIQVGCMDPTAANYNPFAVVDDGECELPHKAK